MAAASLLSNVWPDYIKYMYEQKHYWLDTKLQFLYVQHNPPLKWTTEMAEHFEMQWGRGGDGSLSRNPSTYLPWLNFFKMGFAVLIIIAQKYL